MKPAFIDTEASTSGLLTATGAETVYDTTVAISFTIDGKRYSKAAVTDGATPTTDGNSAALSTLTANQGCVMVWCLNSSGTVGVFQGDTEELDSAGNFVVAPSFPYVNLKTWCPFAYQVLKAGSTAGTITFGSSNWNATGFTNSIKNVSTLPARPQES
jgi:hypothetical protein